MRETLKMLAAMRRRPAMIIACFFVVFVFLSQQAVVWQVNTKTAQIMDEMRANKAEVEKSRRKVKLLEKQLDEYKRRVQKQINELKQ